MRTSHKYALLASLYVTQGLPFGFFLQTMPVILKKEGLSNEAIGLSALLALPWAIKFIWAHLLDRYASRTKWILISNSLTIVTLICLSQFNISQLVSQYIWILMLAIFLLNLFASNQDIATDGFAVNLFKPKQRGFANSIQVAGYRLGMILSGASLLFAYDYLGWQKSLYVLSALILLFSLPIIFHQQHSKDSSEAKLSMKDFIAFFKQSHLSTWLLILILYKAGDAMGTSMLKPMLVEQGLSYQNFGFLFGIVGFGTGLIGALLGGLLVNPLGRMKALLYFTCIQAAAIASWSLADLFSLSQSSLALLVGFEHIASGMCTAALFTLMMDHCNNQSASSDYAIQSSLNVLAKIIATAIGGMLVGITGYTGLFILGACLALLCFPLIKKYQRYFKSEQIT